ncbi:alpha/beta hydrolase [Bradyrhizobium sp. LTSP885]|uniref:alpha/beta fold hydrolase n=1 Tax=Bradyrhizobium sp. LTSP885 TaxID=1619232 RepID=UPI0005E5C14E|nr:alpha/beta hydrolase [Bradyrhizobium sp. LTSP885]KJC48750.1 alpha/beta hydrolase [Bradyrhizobium sp. LTSP885]
MVEVLTEDGIRLYCEEAGSGVPVIFVHEFAGDHRAWEPQVRHLSRTHRCVTFASRGYLPSDVPTSPESYSQDLARSDVIAVLDALGIEKAHIVGHSMGAYTALHVGIHHPDRCLSIAAIGCGWGSKPEDREQSALACEQIAQMFEREPIAEAAAKYARFPMRATFEAKDPRGFADFEAMLAQHSPLGSALTMRNLQQKRPTLWDLKPLLEAFTLPLLVLVGDEDHPCLDGSLFLKRTVPQAALVVVPRTGHTTTLEEPHAVNSALSELFSAVALNAWTSHRTRNTQP